MIWNCRPAILTACLFFIAPMATFATENDSAEPADQKDTVSWPSKHDSSSTLYKIEKKTETNLFQLRATATDRKYTGTDTGTFGLEALYGHLFATGNNDYKGYYFFSGKLRSDNTQRVNATFGYFPPAIGGELKLTYRLLHTEVHQFMPITGEFEENALEQGIALYYKKYSNILLRELTFNYAFTHMGGESDVTGPHTFDTPASWKQSNVIRGFGDTETHNALIEVAFGTDTTDIPLLSGYRLDLGGGYQRATYGEFYNVGELTNDGFTGFVKVQVCTPVGVVIGAYDSSPSADTNYGGYKIGGLEAYYKKIDYEFSDTQEIIGLNLTFDFFNPGSFFDKSCLPFFHPSETNYTSTDQMSHIAKLASDEFTAQKVNEILDDIYQVDKSGLPGNVRVDPNGDGEPRLIITTTCPQVNVLSVAPAHAASAFSLNNNEIYIGLAGLPADRQNIVARIDDICCGDTLVTVSTGSSSRVVSDVNVQERVGCVPLFPDGSPCSTDAQCQAGLCGSSGTCGGDLRDGCTGDNQCKARLCGSSGTCGGDNNLDPCTLDSECKAGICDSNVCGGNNGHACNLDTECKIGICGTNGLCGRENGSPCNGGNECQSFVCGLPPVGGNFQVCL